MRHLGKWKSLKNCPNYKKDRYFLTNYPDKRKCFGCGSDAHMRKDCLKFSPPIGNKNNTNKAKGRTYALNIEEARRCLTWGKIKALYLLHSRSS
jgi:hypothetical protein